MTEDVRPPARRVEKPWGHELIWAHTDRYVGKVLVIEAGKRLSLQRHEVKDESIYVTSGRLRLYLEDEHGTVQIEYADEPGAINDRDDHFGSGCGVAGDVPGKGVDILD